MTWWRPEQQVFPYQSIAYALQYAYTCRRAQKCSWLCLVHTSYKNCNDQNGNLSNTSNAKAVQALPDSNSCMSHADMRYLAFCC